MKSGDEKNGKMLIQTFKKLKFNLLIINFLIFLLTIILDNSDFSKRTPRLHNVRNSIFLITYPYIYFMFFA